MSSHNHTEAEHGHTPVLLDEVILGLAVEPADVVVDATAGRGGHASAIAAQLEKTGTLVLCDMDQANLAYSSERVGRATAAKIIPLNCSFAAIPRTLAEKGLLANALLADLGFASNQMEDPERGFSMMQDGPIDMRLDPTAPITAAHLLAAASEEELARIIREYGEDPAARTIARFLVRKRAESPIQSTAELARLVREAYGPRARSSRLHPATRTFQALRIAVNDELGALDGLLSQVNHGAQAAVEGRQSWLTLGSRVAFITFHSLEDRRVKQSFAEMERRNHALRSVRKPITASDSEIAANPRARSAKLRVATVGGSNS